MRRLKHQLYLKKQYEQRRKKQGDRPGVQGNIQLSQSQVHEDRHIPGAFKMRRQGSNA